MIPDRARWALAAGSTVVVAAAVGVGLWQVGPPGQARLQRLDDQRSRDLAALDAAIRRYARARGALPRTLDDLPDVSDGRSTDPESEAPYEYRADDAETFSLCADFATARSTPSPPVPRAPSAEAPEYWKHDRGRVCFTSELAATDT